MEQTLGKRLAIALEVAVPSRNAHETAANLKSISGGDPATATAEIHQKCELVGGIPETAKLIPAEIEKLKSLLKAL